MDIFYKNDFFKWTHIHLEIYFILYDLNAILFDSLPPGLHLIIVTVILYNSVFKLTFASSGQHEYLFS